jgi:MarR family transcriptional regulator, 2-MHQ and catechol-resistance regulon repressor
MKRSRPAPPPPRRSYGPAADRALNLWVALARCAASVGRASARDIQRFGLTQAQFAVLEVLYHKGPLPLCEIGEKLLVTSGNITYVADQLERSGYLRRERSPADRRVVLAHLRPKGRALLARAFPRHAACIADLAGALGPGEQRQLARLLKKWGKASRAAAG